jgi:putative CocE/NonD family hydrolase
VWTFGVENPNFYPDSIAVPTFMIGGWYDHNVDLMLEFFSAIRTQSPANVQNQHRLLMGPWAHGGNSTASVGSVQQGELSYPNAYDWNDSLALLFFDYHLRGIQNSWNSTPVVQYYTMGDNAWSSSTAWPPTGVTPVTLYMHTDTTMDLLPPSSASGSISYLYDPNDPSPTHGGTTLRHDQVQGPHDQSDTVESRNDILTFTTAPLAQDATIAGAITVHLEITSDKFDTDFCVRLCDVYPGGESMLINDGVYRMRFRDGFDAVDTNNMVPNQHYAVDIVLPHTSLTILQGHSLRVDVTSSNYPRFNRNMNTGQAMYPGPIATAGDTLVNPQIANNTVYTNSQYASRVTIPALSWPTSVNEPVPSAITVFPNPATDHVDITNADNANRTYKIIDATGRVVIEQQSAGNVTRIDVSALAPGVYTLLVSAEAGIATQEIIVQ